MKKLASILLLACSFLSLNTVASDLSENWQTMETEHFRFHFKPEFQQWTEEAAKQLEHVQKQVLLDQQRIIEKKIDVVVFDPLNLTNGSAYPFSHRPMMRLYTTAPTSDSALSNSDSWTQLLSLHEYIHLIHLAQKSRGELDNFLSKWSDLYDAISIPGERWVAEGYATLQESKMTGRGRLFADNIEALIKQFAREGALPTYSQLSSTQGGYLTGSMAYLVGSRFLFWLEQQYGADKLDAVWTRWRAVKSRSFDQAFYGVYRKSASQLYKQFVALYTYETIAADKLALTSNDNYQAEKWLDLKASNQSLSISPDGKYVALIHRTNDRKSYLDVYETAANDKAKESFEKRKMEILKADPKDIPETEPELFNRKRSYRLKDFVDRNIDNPQWRNNQTILFTAKQRNEYGNLYNGLFQWNLDSDVVTEVYANAYIRRFDISSDGNTIYAERNKHGQSSLIKLDLSQTETSVDALTASSLKHIYDMPRLSPNQKKLAFMQHSVGELWQLKVRNLQNSRDRIIPMPQGYQFASYPSWKDDNTLLFVAGVKGKLAIYQYSFKNLRLSKVSDDNRAIASPEYVSDIGILYVQHDSIGTDVMKLELIEENETVVTQLASQPLNQQQPISEHSIAKTSENLPTPQLTMPVYDYGIGPQDYSATIGLNLQSASYDAIELGVKGGDPLQRFDWQTNFSTGSAKAVEGLSANLRWRGWPVEMQAHYYNFSIENDFVNQQDRRGIWLQGNYPMIFTDVRVDLYGQMSHHSGDVQQFITSIGVEQNWQAQMSDVFIRQSANWQWLEGESNRYDDHWNGFNGDVSLSMNWHDLNIEVSHDWKERSNSIENLITIGGSESTLWNGNVHNSHIFDPALDYFSQSSNRYKSYRIDINYDWPANLFYAKHQLSGQPEISQFGIEFEQSFNFATVGLRDLSLKAGAAEVEIGNQDSELQFWLNLWYDW